MYSPLPDGASLECCAGPVLDVGQPINYRRHIGSIITAATSGREWPSMQMPDDELQFWHYIENVMPRNGARPAFDRMTDPELANLVLVARPYVERVKIALAGRGTYPAAWKIVLCHPSVYYRVIEGYAWRMSVSNLMNDPYDVADDIRRRGMDI